MKKQYLGQRFTISLSCPKGTEGERLKDTILGKIRIKPVSPAHGQKYCTHPCNSPDRFVQYRNFGLRKGRRRSNRVIGQVSQTRSPPEPPSLRFGGPKKNKEKATSCTTPTTTPTDTVRARSTGFQNGVVNFFFLLDP